MTDTTLLDVTTDADKIITILESMAADQKRALRIPCPTCGAAIGEPCHPAAKPDQAVAPHIARADAARPLGQDDESLRRATDMVLCASGRPRTTDKKRAWLKALFDIYRDELDVRVPADDDQGVSHA